MSKQTFTIHELINSLTKIKAEQGNLEVGTVGHYGEFYSMSEYNVCSTRAREDMNSSATKNVVNITVPDIGPEPD